MKRVAITGARGLLGEALRHRLGASGADVVELVRAPRPGAVAWNPHGGWDASPLEGVDAVVHLAGASVAGRWTAGHKRAIMESRQEGTASLCRGLAILTRKPSTLVCASAIGIYGDGGDAMLTEDSPPGAGFLADVVRAWEAASAEAEQAGIRVVHLRLGVVLSARGGALRTMLLPFRLGLGGPVGGGRQFMSWVALDDAARAFVFALDTPTMAGTYNLVAPEPVTNAAFTAALGRVLKRPTVLPLPAFVVKALLGEMGREMLLYSQRVSSRRLQEAGFRFEEPSIDGALRRALSER